MKGHASVVGAALGAAVWLVAACSRGPTPAPTRVPTAHPRAAAPTPADGDVPASDPPPAVARWLDAVQPAMVRASVDTLAAFGTRHTLSADHPTTGIAAARRWLAGEFERFGGRLVVTMDAHPHAPDGKRIDTPVDVVNVVATLPGTMPAAAARHYYVVGHYDSRASDPLDRTGPAPGANDDASGVAVVLALAQVLADARLDATVVFMATAGEEQGLLGARAHAAAAAAAGVNIVAVLSNDIVGDPSTSDGTRADTEVRLFSEGLPEQLDDAGLQQIRQSSAAADGGSRQLARAIDLVARWHDLPVRPRLVFRHDRFLRGGDHTAFNAHGVSAVRFTEVSENYDRQHQDPRQQGDRQFGDQPQFVDAEYLAGVARLNLAALVHLANAPSAPGAAVIEAHTLTNDTTVRWQASPEPDVAGYEVVWRATTDAQWQHHQDVGPATHATLPLHKDDWHFGVRAYDQAGYRSPVSFPAVDRG